MRRKIIIAGCIVVAFLLCTALAIGVKIIHDIRTKTPFLSPQYTQYVRYYGFQFDTDHLLTIAFMVSDKQIADQQLKNDQLLNTGIVMWWLRPWWTIIPYMG